MLKNNFGSDKKTGVKKITVSFANWVFQRYILNYNGNRSKYIEEMFIKGYDLSTSDLDFYKAKNIEFYKLIKELEEENKNLKLQLGSLKQKLSKQPSPDMQRKIMKADSLKAMGWVNR